ncbi:MAG: nucleotidyltransferase family protein [Acidimicrobiia bacterium]
MAVAILAAGRGERLGADSPKPLVTVNGRPMVAIAVDAATASGLAPVLAVLGHEAGAVRGAVPSGVEVVVAPDWELGISASLRAALDALEARPEVDAVCVGLADQPRVGPGSYRRLAAARAEGATLAVATYGGRRGNPVLLGREIWVEARRLGGDVGARALFRTHAVVEVECGDTGRPDDVDTLEDRDRLEGWET